MTSELRLKKCFVGLESRSLAITVLQLKHRNVTDKQLDKRLKSRTSTVSHSTTSAGHLKSYIGNNF